MNALRNRLLEILKTYNGEAFLATLVIAMRNDGWTANQAEIAYQLDAFQREGLARRNSAGQWRAL